MDKPINKFRVLLDFERGDIQLSQAAETLEARAASDVIRSLVAYREHLPYLVEAAERLAMQHNSQGDRRVIVEEVATKLGITVRQVNRMMKNTNIVTPSPYKFMMRQLKEVEAKEKWRTRFECALSVIAGADKMEDAAERSEVTTRQMYRWVNKLLDTQEIKLRDLRKLQIYRRKEIADHIEQTQGEHFELHINGRGSSEEAKPVEKRPA